MTYEFMVESGKTVMFPVGGKYCDRDIKVTARGNDGVIIEPLEITENGVYTSPEGINGYSPIVVNVPHIEDDIVSKSLEGAYINERITSIGEYAFRGCKKVTAMSFPKVTSIATYAFCSCAKMVTIDIPLVTSIATYAFYDCEVMGSIDLPSVTSIGANAFQACDNLGSVNAPVLKTLGGTYTFRGCGKLRFADLGAVESLPANTFYGCSQLETIILRRTDAICSLANVSAISPTKVSKGTGYIYVPTALVDEYKVATNWSTYAAQFRAIEDYSEIVGG